MLICIRSLRLSLGILLGWLFTILACSCANDTAPGSANENAPAAANSSQPWTPTAEELRTFKNNIRLDVEHANPNSRMIDDREWASAVEQVWRAQQIHEHMNQTLVAIHGTQAEQEAMLRTLAEAGDHPPNLLMTYVGAWRGFYGVCVGRIQEVLGKEKTQRVLREIYARQDNQANDG